jgi:hypothetical protein
MRLLLVVYILFGGLTLAHAQVPREQCFPVDSLNTEDRAVAEELLLAALDREALYTIIGGIKPMSSGFFQMQLPTTGFGSKEQSEALERLQRTSRAIRALRCGDSVFAELQPFDSLTGNNRSIHGVFFHRKSFDQMVRNYQGFWAFYAVSPEINPLVALLRIDSDPTPNRFRGFGYLFGYPAYAVDFFVDAANQQRKTGKFVERDFVQIPTFERETGAFVYAVPKGHKPNSEDERLREITAPVLEYYRYLRPKYIGNGLPGVIELIRDWMDDGTGTCSPETAMRKANAWHQGRVPASLTPRGG